jgi:hypothetical protein
MEAGLIQALVGSGPLGLLILYLMQLRKQDRENLTEERVRRDALERDRIATDRELAAALSALSVRIDGLNK